MQYERTKDIKVLQISCSDSERYLPPEPIAVETMKKLLRDLGQIHPISVYPITRNSYRLISGATRFRAAVALQWKTIRASIWTGSAIDFEIHELAENVGRHELSAAKRKEMRAKIKELQARQLANIAPSKGGRGKKGGLADAARQADMPRSTAQRRQAKPAHNPKSGQVSRFATYKFAFEMPMPDYERLVEWCRAQNISRSDGLRRVLREWLNDHVPRANQAQSNGKLLNQSVELPTE
jgi:ParB-like nuclease domain